MHNQDAMSSDLVRELVAEARQDEVGLWLIVHKLRNDYGLTDPVALRAETLNLVRRLLESGEVVAGYYKPDGSGVGPWNIAIPEIVGRIDSEWDALGHEPDIGDIVIFVGNTGTDAASR